jgi:hypothetical protein
MPPTAKKLHQRKEKKRKEKKGLLFGIVFNFLS